MRFAYGAVDWRAAHDAPAALGEIKSATWRTVELFERSFDQRTRPSGPNAGEPVLGGANRDMLNAHRAGAWLTAWATWSPQLRVPAARDVLDCHYEWLNVKVVGQFISYRSGQTPGV